jgi:hypothetical protein
MATAIAVQAQTVLNITATIKDLSERLHEHQSIGASEHQNVAVELASIRGGLRLVMWGLPILIGLIVITVNVALYIAGLK